MRAPHVLVGSYHVPFLSGNALLRCAQEARRARSSRPAGLPQGAGRAGGRRQYFFKVKAAHYLETPLQFLFD